MNPFPTETDKLKAMLEVAEWMIENVELRNNHAHPENGCVLWSKKHDEYVRMKSAPVEPAKSADHVERVLITLANAAYHWGKSNGEGRSEKNFNHFLGTSNYENALNQLTANQFAAQRMPSEEESFMAMFPKGEKDKSYSSFKNGWNACFEWLRNKLK